MKDFKYETHLHTSESSACATCSGKEHANHYKQHGYAGIVVTDHFFGGNTTVPSYYPWEKRVELFCKGYENALAQGEKIGLEVYFGWEANYQGTEFLVYGLDKAWLIHHPEVVKWSIKEQYEHVSADGGMVVHAHPFREAEHINEIRLFPNYVDAVEGINRANDGRNLEFNKRALAYAKEQKLPITGGSDQHGSDLLEGGMIFEKRLEGIQDFIRCVKSGVCYSVK